MVVVDGEETCPNRVTWRTTAAAHLLLARAPWILERKNMAAAVARLFRNKRDYLCQLKVSFLLLTLGCD